MIKHNIIWITLKGKKMTENSDKPLMPQDPRTIQMKIDSPEGQVFKTELIQYGKYISEKEYELQKLRAYETHCRLRFQEFLGTPLSEEQKEQLETLNEWIAVWEGSNEVEDKNNG